jgi:hypothetical protein
MKPHLSATQDRAPQPRIFPFPFSFGFVDFRGLMNNAAPITKKNSRIPSQGIQAGIAGTTVTVRGVDAV